MSTVGAEALHDVLLRARERKFLGPVPLQHHLDHGGGFAALVAEGPHDVVVDLGSGGGVPALIVATSVPVARLVLVERSERRAEFLAWAVEHLDLTATTEIVVAEAEDAARRPDLDGVAAVVTARSFAPPAVTAECACRFLRPNGRLVVSEPPDGDDRWPAPALEPLGLRPDDTVIAAGARFRVVHRDPTLPLEDRYPRRAAVTRRRLLF